MLESASKPRHWLDAPVSGSIPLRRGTLLIAAILALAILSRFYMLGARVMSHDEVNHVAPSYDFYQGRGYRFDPMSHGPLQFHLIAWSYYLFGDSDFTSRIPAALFSIATIAFVMVAFRRYLGKVGALVSGLLFVISPYMLFYGRYARNEVFIVFWGVVTLYAILRYLETGETWALYLFTVVHALHFTDKATSYMFAAEELLFLGYYFVRRIGQREWPNPRQWRRFLILLAAAVILAAVVLSTALGAKATPAAGQTAAKASLFSRPLVLLGIVGMLGCGIAAAATLIQSVGWNAIRGERSFDLLILLGTLILPLMAAFPIRLLGFSPTDSSSAGILRAAAAVLPLAVVAGGIGLWWRPRLWLANAAVFYAIFVTFYTTFFTYGAGFFSGLMGGLGYWMEQQAVNRGDQPWYYYAFLQVPLYEFLPALGPWLAAAIGLRRRLWEAAPGEPFHSPHEDDKGQAPLAVAGQRLPVPVLSLILYWSVSSLVVFTYAGEKMPWLTTHIAMPLILATGWGLGYCIETADWAQVHRQRGWLVLLLLPVFCASFGATLSSLLGIRSLFRGGDPAQLQTAATFLIAGVVAVGSGWACAQTLRKWTKGQILRVLTLVGFLGLAIVTARAAIRAAFINYDNAQEYLVYAHAAGDPKYVLSQIEDISRRTAGGLSIVVAYDNDIRYPYWWYMRHYPNHIDYDVNPTRDLRKAAIILVGDANYAKVEPIVGKDYLQFNYIRMVWPNMDYYGLKWDRIESERASARAPGQPPLPPMNWIEYLQGVWRHVQPMLAQQKVRSAIWQIWWNRDYTEYAVLENRKTFTLENWDPASRMRMYIRKDVLAQAGYGGTVPAEGSSTGDPYEKSLVQLEPDRVVGGPGNQLGQYQSPRAVAVAADGSLYVADSRNHRIQHLSTDGTALAAWGTFADVSKSPAPGGTFNEPWGVAVGPDGSVYVADTWNHRVQKLAPDGRFVTMWGGFGLGDKPEGFWGPRGIAVGLDGHVYVADTGNKRIVVFDADGKYIAQFGGSGAGPGQFNEPVAVAVDSAGHVYVTDTWNQRVQAFAPESDGTGFAPLLQWDIAGWYGQSVENKPYVAVDGGEHVWATDPEGSRVLEFTAQGRIVRCIVVPGGSGTLGQPSGIAVDAQGGVWVSDAANHRLSHFTLPGA